MDKQLLRQIPKVDELLGGAWLREHAADIPPAVLTEAVRRAVEELRSQLLAGRLDALPAAQELERRAEALARQAQTLSLRRVVNATGVVLHTNLGRSCLSERAARAAAEAARGYSTLEYDVQSGARGLRYSHVEPLLTRLTGAQSAMVVNNNAAAVLLILSALAAGGEVVASRGELVEIGGSFRVPEIMESCGARLREVGTTNKTHLRDYAAAITPETRALMKVHTSNFRIVGFTESVPLAQLTQLAHERGLPVIEDLGSGSLCDLEQFGLHDEPTVMDSVRAGVDVISFSGDKLLGGPQAGIIVGKKEYIDRLLRHPLTRAMRVDKMTLAALEATLRAYAEGSALREIPTLTMLGAAPETLRGRAQRLCALLDERGVRGEVIPGEDWVGGGSVPAQTLPAWLVALNPACGVDTLGERLRLGEPPVVGRVAHDRYLLDVRTLRDEDFEILARAVAEAER